MEIFFSEVKSNFGRKIGIYITGGEPFLREDIFEILEFLKKEGFRASVVSNGLLINPKNIEKIKNLVSAMSISLDGFEESHNYLRSGNFYKKTLESIELLKENKIIPTIKTTVFRKNIGDLEKFYEFLKELGIVQWQISPMELLGRTNENKKDMLSMKDYARLCEFVDRVRLEKKRKIKLIFEEDSGLNIFKKSKEIGKCKRCTAGISTFSVLHNGDITSCVQNQEKDDIIGNVRENRIKEIWEKGFQKNRQKEYKFCQNHYYLNKISIKK
ncbi:MAG: radical SAM protein [Candidatus Moraniibacteriota bacterium]